MTSVNKTVGHSYLFVPATKIELIQKALTSNADAVIIDMEDTVSSDDKKQARQTLLEFFTESNITAVNPYKKPIWLRINNIRDKNGDNFQQDLSLCQQLSKATTQSSLFANINTNKQNNQLTLSGIVLPKVANGEVIEHAHQNTGLPIIIQLETAYAVNNLKAITSKAHVKGLYAISYGRLDLCNEFNLKAGSVAQQDFFNQLRYQILLISKANGLHAPIESIYPNFNDNNGLKQIVSYVADMGFSGMLAVHPNQLNIINTAFLPSEDEIAFAKKVITHYKQTQDTVFSINGTMVDLPVIKQCERVLERFD